MIQRLLGSIGVLIFTLYTVYGGYTVDFQKPLKVQSNIDFRKAKTGPGHGSPGRDYSYTKVIQTSAEVISRD